MHSQIPHQIICQFPSIPIENRNHSIIDIVKSFNPASSEKQNTAKLNSYPKSSLAQVIVSLKIRHYNKIVDGSKIEKTNKPHLINVILNRLRSLLPQYCTSCNCEYSVQLEDPLHKSRHYCHLCSLPSHTCIASNAAKSLPAWICTSCATKNVGPLSNILKAETIPLPHLPDTPRRPTIISPSPTNLYGPPSPSAPPESPPPPRVSSTYIPSRARHCPPSHSTVSYSRDSRPNLRFPFPKHHFTNRAFPLARRCSPTLPPSN